MAEKKPRRENYITPAGFKRLADELTFLRTKKRPEVVGALGDAAAEGDRSENAEYIYRKRQLREIDRRLRFLSKRLDDVRSSIRARSPTATASSSAPPSRSRTKTARRRPTGSSASTRPTAPRATSPGNRPWAARCSASRSATPSPCSWHAGLRELTVAEIDYR